jgi:succinate dehydrogenase flavin-adding protein (antitoxin of CptAB toxin-antitoxin module)
MTYSREELIKKLNIEHVDADTQEILLDNLADTVSSRVIAKASEKLSDDDLDHLSELIDQGNDDAVEWFIKSKFEHYDKFVEDTEKEVIDEIANNIQVMDAVYKGEAKPSSLLNL